MEKEREAFEAAYIEDDRSNSVDCVDGRYSDGDTREAWHWFSAGVNYALTQPQSGDDKWEDVHLRVYKDDQYKGPGHKCISYKGVIYRPESNPQAGEVVESEHDRIICEREEWPDYTLTEGKPDGLDVERLKAALGKCLTALSFELEHAQQRDDLIAGSQIADAMKAARAALTPATQGEK